MFHYRRKDRLWRSAFKYGLYFLVRKWVASQLTISGFWMQYEMRSSDELKEEEMEKKIWNSYLGMGTSVCSQEIY